MRYDNFIIWGNGINYVPQIIEMIRNDNHFNIVMMKSFQIGNMEEFIKEIYGCDPYPWEHLVAKTKYLLNSPKEMVFVLVKNINPREMVKDKGKFKHVECANVVDLKIKIRNAFNPPFLDSSRRIPPLNAGVSHEHCIHGSDYEEQTEHVLKILNLNSLSYYKRYDDLEYHFPYHLNVGRYKVVDVNLDCLSANIIGKGVVPLEDTPHFKYLHGSSKEYIQYFYKNFGTNLCEDHFPEAFDYLIKNFDPNHVREDGKKSHIIINEQNIIIDGVHRAVILKDRRISKVKCIQISDQEKRTNNYSNLIDLQDYFKNCPHEYCIIKMNEHFPNYYNYSDLDILCTDIKAMIAYTKEFSEKYASKKLRFVVNPLERGHVHVDVYPEDENLNFKFDFVDNLNTYKNFSVAEVLVKNIIESKIVKKGVFVPSTAFDLGLRYMEYVDHAKDRPDKIKHYVYVNQRTEYINEVLKVIKKHTNLYPKYFRGGNPLANTALWGCTDMTIDGKKFRNIRPTKSATHGVGFSETCIVKIEYQNNPRKLNSLEEEAEIITFLNKQGCMTCPKIVSQGRLLSGEPYYIQKRIMPSGIPKTADMLFALIEQKSFGVYQGDFKPENMIFDGSTCYLVDYDQAQQCDSLIKMGNTEYIEWIAGDFQNRRGHEFFLDPDRNFNKQEMFSLFRNNSFNLGETSLLQNQETTNTTTGFYHRLCNPNIFIEGARDLRERLTVLDKIKFKPKEEILDVGCNLGLLSHYLYDKGCLVTGIDLDKNITIAAKMVASILGKSIAFEAMDIGDAVKMRTFDTICLFSVLHHIQNMEGAIASISKGCNRIILECKLNEEGSKPTPFGWKRTNHWKFNRPEDLTDFIESRFAHFKLEKNYGQVDRERFIFSFTKNL